MSQGTTITCEHCGRDIHLGFSISNVTVSGNPNVAILGTDCPFCGRETSAGRGPGTYSTTGGRLRRVVAALAAAEEQELTALLSALRRAADESADADRTAALVEQAVPRLGPVSQYIKDREHLFTAGGFLLALIGVLIAYKAYSVQVTDLDSRTRELEQRLPTAENSAPLVPGGDGADHEQQRGSDTPSGAVGHDDQDKRPR